MTQELQQYVALALLVVAACVLAGGMWVMPSLVGSPRAHDPRKDTPYECGMPPLQETPRRFSVRFYVVAVLFLLLDVAMIFLFAWAVVYRHLLGEMGWSLWWAGALFVLALAVGHAYAWKKGALDGATPSPPDGA